MGTSHNRCGIKPSLTAVLSISRVAKRLKLCTQALKKRGAAQPDAPSAVALPPPLSFVEITATSAWLPTLAEVKLQRAHGTMVKDLAQNIDDHTTFVGKHLVDRRELTTTMSQTAAKIPHTIRNTWHRELQ